MHLKNNNNMGLFKGTNVFSCFFTRIGQKQTIQLKIKRHVTEDSKNKASFHYKNEKEDKSLEVLDLFFTRNSEVKLDCKASNKYIGIFSGNEKNIKQLVQNNRKKFENITEITLNSCRLKTSLEQMPWSSISKTHMQIFKKKWFIELPEELEFVVADEKSYDIITKIKAKEQTKENLFIDQFFTYIIKQKIISIYEKQIYEHLSEINELVKGNPNVFSSKELDAILGCQKHLNALYNFQKGLFKLNERTQDSLMGKYIPQVLKFLQVDLEKQAIIIIDGKKEQVTTLDQYYKRLNDLFEEHREEVTNTSLENYLTSTLVRKDFSKCNIANELYYDLELKYCTLNFQCQELRRIIPSLTPEKLNSHYYSKLVEIIKTIKSTVDLVNTAPFHNANAILFKFMESFDKSLKKLENNNNYWDGFSSFRKKRELFLAHMQEIVEINVDDIEYDDIEEYINQNKPDDFENNNTVKKNLATEKETDDDCFFFFFTKPKGHDNIPLVNTVYYQIDSPKDYNIYFMKNLGNIVIEGLRTLSLFVNTTEVIFLFQIFCFINMVLSCFYGLLFFIANSEKFRKIFISCPKFIIEYVSECIYFVKIQIQTFLINFIVSYLPCSFLIKTN